MRLRSRCGPSRHRRPASSDAFTVFGRRGLSLVEVSLAVSLTSLLALTLANLTLAGRTAAVHLEAVDSARLQFAVLRDRVDDAVAGCGRYQLSGQQSRLGLRPFYADADPQGPAAGLVCWTGGRGMDRSTLPPPDRLPRAEELVIFAPDRTGGDRMLESVVPGDTTGIDFTLSQSAFDTVIHSLLAGPSVQSAVLCNAVTFSGEQDPSGGYGGGDSGGGYSGGSGGGTGGSVGGTTEPDRHYGGDVMQPSGEPRFATRLSAVSFAMRKSPTDGEIAAASTATDWYELDWYQGQSSDGTGIRHVLLTMEVQFDGASRGGDRASWPLYGAFERLEVHDEP